MAITPKVTELSRAIQAAEGILKGVAADSKLNALELQRLREWLDMHANFADIVPFSEVYSFLAAIQASEEVTPGQTQELVEFCRSFTAADGPIDAFTAEIRRLHGILQGISADSQINAKEVRFLRDWVDAHFPNCNLWPVNEIHQRVASILADGRVSKAEQTQLLEFCRNFSYQLTGEKFMDDTILPDMAFLKNDAPVVNSIEYIADHESPVTIKGMTFCFTGQMRAGKRKDIQREVEELGGRCSDSINRQLNYLVIGANSNPCWTYATYGRKIEAVMENRRLGIETAILMERRFIPILRG